MMPEFDLPTKFTESNALLAVASDDDEMAREILRDSTRGELQRLSKYAARLADLCDDLLDQEDPDHTNAFGKED
jgi:hypothetical protein